MSPMFCPCGGGTNNQVMTARESWEAKQQYLVQKQAEKAAVAAAASSAAPALDKPGVSSTIISSTFGRQPGAVGSPPRRKGSNSSGGRRQVVIVPFMGLSPEKIVAAKLDQHDGNDDEEHEETASSSPVTTEQSLDNCSNFYDISPPEQQGNGVAGLDGKPPRPRQQHRQQGQEKIATCESRGPSSSTHRWKSTGSSATLCVSPASSTVSQDNQRQQSRRKSSGGGGGFGSRNASPILPRRNSQHGLAFGSRHSSSNSSPASSQRRRSSTGGSGIGAVGFIGPRNASPRIGPAAGATTRIGPRLSGSFAATPFGGGALRSGDHPGMKKEVRRAIISADMPGAMQQDAMDCAAHAIEAHELQKDIAAFIKKEFDKMHDPT